MVAAALLRGRPAVRHLLLHAALLVYLLGPLWIRGGADLTRRGPPGDAAGGAGARLPRRAGGGSSGAGRSRAGGRGGACRCRPRPRRRPALVPGAVGGGLRPPARPPGAGLGARAADAPRGGAARAGARPLDPGHARSGVPGSEDAAGEGLGQRRLAAGGGRPAAHHPPAGVGAGAGPDAAGAGAGARDGARPARRPARRAPPPDRGRPPLAQSAGPPVPARPGAGPGGELRRPGAGGHATRRLRPHAARGCHRRSSTPRGGRARHGGAAVRARAPHPPRPRWPPPGPAGPVADGHPLAVCIVVDVAHPRRHGPGRRGRGGGGERDPRGGARGVARASHRGSRGRGAGAGAVPGGRTLGRRRLRDDRRGQRRSPHHQSGPGGGRVHARIDLQGTDCDRGPRDGGRRRRAGGGEVGRTQARGGGLEPGPGFCTGR